ncbi:MAG: S8 family peptidase [Candidatus Rifleibacteriota bacterium]
MRYLLLALMLLSGPLVAEEIPCQPFEPFDAGREYSMQDIQTDRTGQFPDDPFFDKQWHLENRGQPDDKEQIGIPGCDAGVREAWQCWQPKQDIILAILDSGLDLQHEDIDPAILWTNPGESGTDSNGQNKATNGIDDDNNGYIDDLHGYNFVRNCGDIQDDQYHGTHCGSIICATTNNGTGLAGMNPRLKIMVVKIFGLGGTLYGKEIAQAVKYAVDNGAKVLSNSYGTPSYQEDMLAGIKYAHEKGALFVCASGNSRKDLNNSEEYDYPSCYGVENQLVVGATDNCDRSTFANYGTNVEIAAPGLNIFSLMPKNKYRSFSGTSQACPQVAAAAAMVWCQNPSWTWKEVKNALLQGADQVYGLGRYVKNGLRLNVANSLKGLTGKRLPEYDFSTWKSDETEIESEHPYWNEKEELYSVEVPNAKCFRVHFEKIEMDHHGDLLQIMLPGNESPLEIINGRFTDSWSEVIEGNQAEILLLSDKYVGGYGFKIDKIQWLE